ncbi:hypothetical protein SCHPADRAFT_947203 [Schizopora paradoxa]|uniref:Uncharacterized protein n=1 Tax=Schizopora paradoxa TaxID=27342 RepID=A0A0H2RJW1_9AGAM|nr:hypothetical protein SCHPADRAFT_947203 [Schizopora paradoxa]
MSPFNLSKLKPKFWKRSRQQRLGRTNIRLNPQAGGGAPAGTPGDEATPNAILNGGATVERIRPHPSTFAGGQGNNVPNVAHLVSPFAGASNMVSRRASQSIARPNVGVNDGSRSLQTNDPNANEVQNRGFTHNVRAGLLAEDGEQRPHGVHQQPLLAQILQWRRIFNIYGHVLDRHRFLLPSQRSQLTDYILIVQALDEFGVLLELETVDSPYSFVNVDGINTDSTVHKYLKGCNSDWYDFS